MNITLILSASTFLVVPLVTAGSVYYFREDILKVYERYCTNFPVDLRTGNGSGSRVPQNRIERKEIELTKNKIRLQMINEKKDVEKDLIKLLEIINNLHHADVAEILEKTNINDLIFNFVSLL